MKIIKETTLLELVGVGIIDDSMYAILSKEGFKNVNDVLNRTRDHFFLDSLKNEEKNFVSFLIDIISFFEQYENGIIENDNTIVLPSSLVFTIRSIYINEKKKFGAEFTLSLIIDENSELFTYSFLYNLFTSPMIYFDENRIKNILMRDSLASKNIEFEIERYRYVMISIVTKIIETLCNFPENLYYMRLMRLVAKEVGFSADKKEKAEYFAKVLNYKSNSTDDNTDVESSIDNEIQTEYERLKSNLSRRTLNIIISYLPSYKDALPWVEGKQSDFKFKNCGKKSIIELRGFIGAFSNFYFDYINSPSTKRKAAFIDTALSDKFKYLIKNEFEKESNRCLDIYKKLLSIYNGWDLLVEDILKYPEQIYIRLSEYSKKDTLDGINFVIQLCSNISFSLRNIEDYKQISSILYNAINVLVDLRSQNLSNLEYNKFITPDKDVLLQQEFNKMKSRCSGPCKNVLENNNLNYKDFLSFKGREHEFRNFRNVGKRCVEDLSNLLDVYYKTYNIILNNDSKEARCQKYQNIFPFLSEQDLSLVDYYYSCYKHYPMFYILCIYFKNTDYQNARIFAHYSGLDDNSLFDYSKIGDLYGCSNQRVRQIIGKRDFSDKTFKMIMNPSLWETYSLNFEGVMTENTSYYNSICEEERLNISFYTFSCLLTLMLDVVILNVSDSFKNIPSSDIGNYVINDMSFKTYVFSSRYKGFKFPSVFSEIMRLKNLRRDAALRIPLHIYFASNPDYWAGGAPVEESQMENFMLILETIIKDNIDDEIENHNLLFEANKTNYSDLIYELLKNNGECMHIQDIFSKFKCIYPDSKFVEAKQMKPYLFKDSRIKSIGRSSYYTLLEWNDYTGSLFELANDIVNSKKAPILISELAKEMLEYRPSSNEHSVHSMIYQSINDGKLVLYYGEMVGSPHKSYTDEYIIMPRSFVDWVKAFESFVSKNNCYPIGANKGFEGALYNWYLDSRTYIGLNSEEILIFHNLMKKYEKVPHTLFEKKFLKNCNLYMAFYKQSGRLLTQGDDKTLFSWFENNKEKYNLYTDNRKLYFQELINYLSKQT